MDEKKIKEIMEDPNTWEWDGCTLPEWTKEQEREYDEAMAKLLPHLFK